jgi:hypothetical protein
MLLVAGKSKAIVAYESDRLRAEMQRTPVPVVAASQHPFAYPRKHSKQVSRTIFYQILSVSGRRSIVTRGS